MWRACIREKDNFNIQNVQKNRGEIKGGTNEGWQRDEKECATEILRYVFRGHKL